MEGTSHFYINLFHTPSETQKFPISSNKTIRKKTISIDIPSINYEPSFAVKLKPKIKIIPYHPSLPDSSNFRVASPKKFVSYTPKPPNPNNPKKNLKKKLFPEYKLTPINYPEIATPLQIHGKNSIYKCTSSQSFYFKMLEFYIKVKIEFTPIYSKIDVDKNGWVNIKEVKNYLIGFYPDSEEAIKSFCKLVFKACQSKKIMRSWFLGCCSLVRFENSIKSAKTSLILADYSKVQIRLHELQTFFKNFSVKEELDVELIKSYFDGIQVEDIEKCFFFVFSEKVDFARFLRVFPLFLWLNTCWTSI